MSFRKRHPLLAKLTLAIIDGTCFSAAYAFTAHVTRPPAVSYLSHARAGLPALVAALVVWYVVAFRQRLFLTRRGELLVPQLFTTTRVLFTWLILSVFLTVMIAPQRVNRPVLIVFAATSIVLVLLGRAFLRFSVWDLRRRGYNTHRILIVGANECTERLVSTIRANEQFGWQIEGFLDDDPAPPTCLERYRIPYLGKVKELDRLLVQRVIDGVYVNLPLRTSYKTVQNIVNLCEGVGVPVRMVAELFPLRVAWTDVRRISGIPVVSLVSRPSIRLRSVMKRSTESLIASALLLLLSPAMILIGVTIWLTSGRPVLVKQLHLARNKRAFEMLAFRTARIGAEEGITGLTRFGRFLRRYGLDELPQLLNVWRGEVVLAGAPPLKPSSAHPAGDRPECRPELEPGLLKFWNQVSATPRPPLRAECRSAVSFDDGSGEPPEELPRKAGARLESVTTDVEYEGME